MFRNQFTAYPAGGPAQFVNIINLNMEHNLCDRFVTSSCIMQWQQQSLEVEYLSLESLTAFSPGRSICRS